MATSDDFLLDFVGMPHLMKVQLVVTSLLFFVRTEVLRVFFRKIATFTRTRDPKNTTYGGSKQTLSCLASFRTLGMICTLLFSKAL